MIANFLFMFLPCTGWTEKVSKHQTLVHIFTKYWIFAIKE